MAATWQDRTTTSRPSLPKYSPKVKPLSYSTVDAARLSLMGTDAAPILAAHTALVKWSQEFRTWERTALEDRKMRLSQDIYTLTRLVEYPPDDWTPEMWLAMRTRLESWRGQHEALWCSLFAKDRWEFAGETLCSPDSASGKQKACPDRGSTLSAAGSGTVDPFSAEG